MPIYKLSQQTVENAKGKIAAGKSCGNNAQYLIQESFDTGVPLILPARRGMLLRK